MTNKEVAEKFGLSSLTVNKWARSHNLKLVPVKGKAVYRYEWSEEDVELFSKRNTKTGWAKDRPRSQYYKKQTEESSEEKTE